MLRNLKKRSIIVSSFVLFVEIVILYSLLTSRLYFEVGNMFFGDIPTFYNVKLAQMFFERASYPLAGKAYPLAHHQYSRTYFIQGKLEEALFEARKEVALYPENTMTYYLIGLTLGYMNREEEAIDAFGIYLENNPQSWAARNDRTWLQFRIGDIDGALRTIKPVTHATENPWIQNTYGTLLMNKKQYKEARIAFYLAKKAADGMTEESWGRAYPGNDPRIYGTGLSAMKASIEENVRLLTEKENSK